MTIFSVVGCQAVFTFAPFGFAADDPAKMPKAQLVTYGWDVIASGDRAKMTAAFNAIIPQLTAYPTDKDLWYVQANLALALSNAGRIFTHQSEIITIPIDPLLLQNYKLGIDQQYLQMAGGCYLMAFTNGAQLTPVDFIFGGIGLLIDATTDLNDIETFTPTPAGPPPPYDPVLSWPNSNPAARLLLNAGVNALGGYDPGVNI